ncbi:DUF1376 domain-containing protein [Bartonella raoultii]|uniref:YdaU family protein n=1 Tax=Bartonella raoultii TaxID=1457020 RepID=A0ABS7I5G4_9HYPH|nr:DUF1376 domain-containing protein [Bartonella raoultii]MBX4335582.1 YdaU family protein [Bartonella raoultii]
MSTKLPWTRLFSSQWIVDVSGMSIVEKGLYMTLVLYMYEERRPIIEDAPKLARWAGCSERILKKTLDILLRDEKIIRLEDGRLWSLKVEEELNNCSENLDRASEKASKAAKAAKLRWDKNKDKSDDDVSAMQTHCERTANAMRNDAINNNINNIYKKNKTIVLSKKEIDFENLETTDLVEEPIEGDDVQSEQIATSSENQPPIHEQENVPKKAKRVKTDRGCRLPADFEPDYDFALAEGLPPERVKVEIAKFRDYWRSKAGANAAKTDWQATWRNWVRNSKKYEINQQGKNYGNYTQKQKSIGERIADSLLDIGNRGYFEAHSRDDTTTGVPIGFEGWQPINKTAGSDCFRGC